MRIEEIRAYGFDIFKYLTSAKHQLNNNKSNDGMKFTKNLDFILSNTKIFISIDDVSLLELFVMKSICNEVTLHGIKGKIPETITGTPPKILTDFVSLHDSIYDDSDIENIRDAFNMLPLKLIRTKATLSFTGSSVLNLIGITSVNSWDTIKDFNGLIEKNFLDTFKNKITSLCDSIDILSQYGIECRFFKNIPNGQIISLSYISTNENYFSFYLDDELSKLPSKEAAEKQQKNLVSVITDTKKNNNSLNYTYSLKTSFYTFMYFYLKGLVSAHSALQETAGSNLIILSDVVKSKYNVRIDDLVKEFKSVSSPSVWDVFQNIIAGQQIKYIITISDSTKIEPINEELRLINAFINSSISAIKKL